MHSQHLKQHAPSRVDIDVRNTILSQGEIAAYRFVVIMAIPYPKRSISIGALRQDITSPQGFITTLFLHLKFCMFLR